MLQDMSGRTHTKTRTKTDTFVGRHTMMMMVPRLSGQGRSGISRVSHATLVTAFTVFLTHHVFSMCVFLVFLLISLEC